MGAQGKRGGFPSGRVLRGPNDKNRHFSRAGNLRNSSKNGGDKNGSLAPLAIKCYIAPMKRASTSHFDHVYLPATKAHTGRSKLMIVLHGRGDSLKPFRGLQAELGLEHVNMLLLNAPRKYMTGYTWYGFPPNQALGILKGRAKLFSLMEELEAQGWHSTDIYFFGFSQGSLMSCDFGLNYPKPLAGIIGVSGYVYFFAGWRKKVPPAAFQTPWLLTHGIHDDALDINASRRHARRLIDFGLPIEWLELEKEHEIDLEIEAPTIKKFVKNPQQLLSL